MSYFVLTGPHGGVYSKADLDEVSMGVELGWLNHPPTLLTWTTDNGEPGILEAVIPERGQGTEVTKVDASSRWKTVIGGEVGRVYTSQDDGFPHPWAIRLRFTAGTSLVIALGEIAWGPLQYSGDTSIVTTSKQVALGHCNSRTGHSAWAVGRFSL